MARDYTKFFTRPETASLMAALLHPVPYAKYIEPSAGDGALVRAVVKHCPNCAVFACEVDAQWNTALQEFASCVLIGDWLKVAGPLEDEFDGCIANPPFGNGTDLDDHVRKMRWAVKPGGRMVMIVPAEYNPCISHAAIALDNWGTNKDGTVTPIKIISFFNLK